MGLYINPKTDVTSRSKRDTILAAGRRVRMSEFLDHNPGKNREFGVAIIDHGFIAAGVAFTKDEARGFAFGYGSDAEYVILSIDQIAEMDPSCATVLQNHYMK